MSYIKNCTKCGERISMREMTHGQWVAFDANSDKPHKHGKGSQKSAPSPRQSKHINSNAPTSTEPSSNTPIFIISIIVILVAIWFFN